MRVLISYGADDGPVVAIAAGLAHRLRTHGVAVDLRAVGDVDDLDAYDAVVVGSSLIGGRWHADARQFVRQHTIALRPRPVWLFDVPAPSPSGPAGRVADAEEAMARTDAITHVTLAAVSGDIAARRLAERLARSLGVRGRVPS